MKKLSQKLTGVALFLLTGLTASNTYATGNPLCKTVDVADSIIYNCVADNNSTDTTINQDLELTKKNFILSLGDENLELNNNSITNQAAFYSKIALTKDSILGYSFDSFKTLSSQTSAIKIELANKDNNDPHQITASIDLNSDANHTISVNNEEVGFAPPDSKTVLAAINTNFNAAGKYTINANQNNPSLAISSPVSKKNTSTAGIHSIIKAKGDLTINLNGNITNQTDANFTTFATGINALGSTTIDEVKGPINLSVNMEGGTIAVTGKGSLQATGIRALLEDDTAGDTTVVIKDGRIEAKNGTFFIAGVNAGSSGVNGSTNNQNNNVTIIQEGGEVVVDYINNSTPITPGVPSITPPDQPITAGLAANLNYDSSQGLVKVIQKGGSVDVKAGGASHIVTENDRNAAIFADGGSIEIRQSKGASLAISAARGVGVLSRARNNDALLDIAGQVHGNEAALHTLSKKGKTTTIKVADSADLQGEYAIFNNIGNSEITIAQGATLGSASQQSKISLNDGDDNLTFNNTNLENLTLIDGGLDADVTTDFDTLTFSAYAPSFDVAAMINAPTTTNWERYQLANAHYQLKGKQVSVPHGAQGDKVAGLAILDSATVSFNEKDFTVDGSLINKGTIDLRRNTTDEYSVLTVKNDYYGDNGKILYHAKLKGDNTTPSDKVVIEGNVYGSTILELADRKGEGDKTIDGIQLVELAPTSQVADPDKAFILARAVDVGVYEYNTLKLVSGASGSGSGVYLKSQAQSEIKAKLYRQAIPGYLLNPAIVGQALYSLTTNLHQRMGEQRTQTNFTHPDQSWVRVMHNQNHLEIANLKSDNNDFNIQIGWDLDTNYEDKTKTRTGIYGQYTKVESHLGDTFRANHHIPGLIDTDMGSLGLYHTRYRNDHYYDFVASLHYIYSDYEVKNGGDQRGFGGTLSAEFGNTFKLTRNYFIEPQAQLSFQVTHYGNFVDSISTIKGFTNASLRPRLGFRLGYADCKGDDFWFHANLEWELLKKSNLVIDDKVFSSKAGSTTWYNLGLNGQLLLSPTTVFYSSLEYRSSLKDRHSFHGFGAEMGLRFTW